MFNACRFVTAAVAFAQPVHLFSFQAIFLLCQVRLGPCALSHVACLCVVVELLTVVEAEDVRSGALLCEEPNCLDHRDDAHSPLLEPLSTASPFHKIMSHRTIIARRRRTQQGRQ